MALLGRSPLRTESVSISTRASYSPYSAWKCAGLWSLKYIRTTIPKNRVTSGISSFDFTPTAPAASEAASARGNPSTITPRTDSLNGQSAVDAVSQEESANFGLSCANLFGDTNIKYFLQPLIRSPGEP